ncbi:hypothetical protein LCGC14_2749560, partial [marine sediment metagenome]
CYSNLGLCILSFMTTVQARATIRPIDDFVASNDSIAGWLDFNSNIIIYPHWSVEVLSD